MAHLSRSRLLVAALVGLVGSLQPTTGIGEYWSEARRGANLFNQKETAERLQAASELGLDFVRIAPDKWKAAERDFLIGDADEFEGIPDPDLAELRRILDAAERAGIKVVLSMLSLPGARWKQNNDGADDGRLWQEERFHEQTIRFWSDLATALHGHPAVVGYDILNEPHPARTLEGLDDPASASYDAWWQKTRGSEADLNRFYRRVVAAIRGVDTEVPIVIEAAAYGAVRALRLLEPLNDDGVMYSFHFYEPWNFTTRRVNKGRYSYPDRMPKEWDGETEAWSRTQIAEMLEPVTEWASSHGVPATRLLLGEFGCSRQVGGVTEYLADIIDAADRQGWHWAFYSFREDTWSEMDYELGTQPIRWSEIEAVQAGTRSREPYRDNPLFAMLRRKIGD